MKGRERSDTCQDLFARRHDSGLVQNASMPKGSPDSFEVPPRGHRRHAGPINPQVRHAIGVQIIAQATLGWWFGLVGDLNLWLLYIGCKWETTPEPPNQSKPPIGGKLNGPFKKNPRNSALNSGPPSILIPSTQVF